MTGTMDAGGYFGTMDKARPLMATWPNPQTVLSQVTFQNTVVVSSLLHSPETNALTLRTPSRTVAGAGQQLSLIAGNAFGAGPSNGGAVLIQAGNSVGAAGVAGPINVYPGTAPAGTAGGYVLVQRPATISGDLLLDINMLDMGYNTLSSVRVRNDTIRYADIGKNAGGTGYHCRFPSIRADTILVDTSAGYTRIGSGNSYFRAGDASIPQATLSFNSSASVRLKMGVNANFGFVTRAALWFDDDFMVSTQAAMVAQATWAFSGVTNSAPATGIRGRYRFNETAGAPGLVTEMYLANIVTYLNPFVAQEYNLIAEAPTLTANGIAEWGFYSIADPTQFIRFVKTGAGNWFCQCQNGVGNLTSVDSTTATLRSSWVVFAASNSIKFYGCAAGASQAALATIATNLPANTDLRPYVRCTEPDNGESFSWYLDRYSIRTAEEDIGVI